MAIRYCQKCGRSHYEIIDASRTVMIFRNGINTDSNTEHAKQIYKCLECSHVSLDPFQKKELPKGTNLDQEARQ